MTMPHERLHALQWAGELLREIAHDSDKHQELWGGKVPPELVKQASHILRHYPSDHELLAEARWTRAPLRRWLELDPLKGDTGLTGQIPGEKNAN